MIIGICGKAGAGKDAAADAFVANHNYVRVALADPLKRIAREVFDFSEEQLWGPSAKRNEPDPRYEREDGWVNAYRNECTQCGAVHVEPRTGSLVRPEGAPLYNQPCSKGGVHIPRMSNLLGPLYLTPRHALQQLGTEWGRGCYPAVWVDYCMRNAEKLLNDPKYTYLYTAQEGVHDQQPLYPRLGRPYAGVVVSDVRFLNEVLSLRKQGAKVVRIVRASAGLSGAAGQHLSETEQDGIPPELFDAVIDNNGTLEELAQTVALLTARFSG